MAYWAYELRELQFKGSDVRLKEVCVFLSANDFKNIGQLRDADPAREWPGMKLCI